MSRNKLAGRKCIKCGERCIRKGPDLFYCKRHGFQPGNANRDRSGRPQSREKNHEEA